MSIPGSGLLEALLLEFPPEEVLELGWALPTAQLVGSILVPENAVMHGTTSSLLEVVESSLPSAGPLNAETCCNADP